jgi:hypothetical protein
MKGSLLLCIPLLVLLAQPMYASAIQVNSEEIFLESIQTSYLFEDFAEYSKGAFSAKSLALNEDGYSAELSTAISKLYSGPGIMAARYANDILTIRFSGISDPVTAIGGYFWPIGSMMQNLTGYTKIKLSDGSVYEVTNANSSSFLGFISQDGTVFESLEISVLGGNATPYTWPAVDNLYVGNAKPIPDDQPIANPEPSTLVLLATGLCGACLAVFKKF